MYTPREEGETAFPDLATIDARICEVKNARLKAAREECERAEAEAEERNRREHPENYFDVREMIHDFIKRKGIECIPPKKPTKPFCEHCNGVQLEAFTAADFRALADVVEKREQLKTTERQAGSMDSINEPEKN
jgi:molybdenum cofactor biosynthesis enzyme MoaA